MEVKGHFANESVRGLKNYCRVLFTNAVPHCGFVILIFNLHTKLPQERRSMT